MISAEKIILLLPKARKIWLYDLSNKKKSSTIFDFISSGIFPRLFWFAETNLICIQEGIEWKNIYK